MRKMLLNTLTAFSFSLFACSSSSTESPKEDIDLEWDETGVEEDSVKEDLKDIRDSDTIDDESEVIDEQIKSEYG